MSLEDWLMLHFNGSPDDAIRVKYWDVKCRFARELTRHEQCRLHDLLDEWQPGWVGQDGVRIDCTEKRPGDGWVRWFVSMTQVTSIAEVLLAPLHFYKPMPYIVDMPICLWVSDEHFTTPDWTEWFNFGMKQQAKES